MEKCKATNSYSRTSFWGWVLALGSVAVVLSAAVVVHIFTEGVSVYLTYADLKSSVLLRSTDVEVMELLDRMAQLRPSRVTTFVVDTVESSRDTHDPLPIQILARQTLASLQAKQFERARGEYYLLLSNHRYGLINLLGAGRNGLEILEGLSGELSHGVELDRSVKQHQAEIERLHGELRDQVNQFLLVASDLGELLSIAALESANPIEPLPVYRLGVLAGIPKVPQIPDNISDLVSFREKLQRVSGNVRLNGPNVHLLFQDKLRGYRESVAAIESKHTRLLEVRRTEEQAIQQLDSELRLINESGKELVTRSRRPGGAW